MSMSSAILVRTTTGISPTLHNTDADFRVTSSSLNFGVILRNPNPIAATAIGTIEAYIGSWVTLTSFSLTLDANSVIREAPFNFVTSGLAFADYRLNVASMTGSGSNLTLFVLA